MHKTPLNARHRELGARMVDFGGWDMPLHYGSQMDEHHRVRRHAGMFDVSHMAVVDLQGDRVREFLRRLLANDVARLTAPGKALYSCMLNERGGVIDDLIVYFQTENWFRVVVNAATRSKDLAWMRKHAEAYGVEVLERAEQAMIAVQGPEARNLFASLLPAELAAAALALTRFQGLPIGDLFVGRTGYTGEDGFELVLPAAQVLTWWDRLLKAGVSPCGLGARDTLRLEAGLHLYGQDMDEDTTPLECGLDWTLVFEPEDRDFIGRGALLAQREAGVPRQMLGLILDERGVLRHGQQVRVNGERLGSISSGSFSPTLNRSVALALVPSGAVDTVEVDMRGRWTPVRVAKPNFVRNGKALAGVLPASEG